MSRAEVERTVRAAGLADLIDDAPDWRKRADALYAEFDAGLKSLTTRWDGGCIGLLADGRMAVLSSLVGIAEVRS